MAKEKVKVSDISWLKCPQCSKKFFRFLSRTQIFKCYACGALFTVDTKTKTAKLKQASIF